MPNPIFRRTLVPLAVAVALVLSSCSGGHSSSGHGSGTDAASTIPADAAFNQSDVGFSQGMITHHRQAVVMADDALARSANPAVVALATKIKAAQEPEIALMTSWLQTWGEPMPDPEHGQHMTEMSGMEMSGIMTDAQMTELANASGQAFDTLFLELMIEHHQGAITMANDEIANGKSPEAVALAKSIITAQQSEIDEMKALLA